MKIDFSTVLRDPDDFSKEAKDSNGVLVTLGVIARSALNADLQDERRSGEDKYAAYKLADRIRNASSAIDVKVDQVTLIKQRIGKAYPPAIMGQCWDLLEPPAAEPEGEKAA